MGRESDCPDRSLPRHHRRPVYRDRDAAEAGGRGHRTHGKTQNRHYSKTSPACVCVSPRTDVDQLVAARPDFPEALQQQDRARDNWELLLAIADVAGGDWPVKARAAAVDPVDAASQLRPETVDLLEGYQARVRGLQVQNASAPSSSFVGWNRTRRARCRDCERDEP